MEKFSKRFGKEPPHDIRAECSVLGSILLDNATLPVVLENIESSEDFYLEKHRVIFRAIEELFNSNSYTSIDVVTLRSHLKDRGDEEKAGGYEYLVSLLEQTPTSANCEYYAKIVRDKSLVRKMITAADEIVNRGYGDEIEAEDFLSHAESQIFKVSQGRLKSPMESLQKVMDQTGEIIERLYQNKGQTIGISSGFKLLDQKLLGFQKSDLIILAARPGMGKTSLAMNIALNAARKGHSVAFFSLEMSKDQLAIRLVCSEVRIDSNTLRSGFITSAQLGEITSKIAQIRQLPMYIDDAPRLRTSDILSKAMRLKLEKKCDMVIVDYIQLIEPSDRKIPREQQVSEISRSLKAIAKDLKVPVIALSQLNRGPEDRTDKRPMLPDLRESGALEQDADVVLFLYRDDYYDENSDEKGTAEVIIGKHRNGPTGTVKLAYLKDYTLFQNLETRDSDIKKSHESIRF